jgi:outer membrane protein
MLKLKEILKVFLSRLFIYIMKRFCLTNFFFKQDFKLIHYYFFMFFKAFLVFILLSTSAFAKFAVVDIKKIEDKALVAKSLKEQLTKASEELESDVNSAREKMEQKVTELQKIVSTLSPDAVEKKKAELQKEFISVESSLQQRDSELQEARMKALEEINDKIKQIAEKIAKEKKLEMVFASNVLIYHSPENDITNDVISILDKEMTSIKFLPQSSKSKSKKK